MAVTETIQQILQGIDSAQYGRDMRQYIHKGIEKCYDDGRAGTIDLEARNAIQNIGLLSSYDFQPENKTGRQASEHFELDKGIYLAILNGKVLGTQNDKQHGAYLEYYKGSGYVIATPFAHVFDMEFNGGEFSGVIPFEIADDTGYFDLKLHFSDANTYTWAKISVQLLQII